MGRRSTAPGVIVAPISSKKQLLSRTAACAFLGGISPDSLDRLRNNPEERFPQPLQMLGQSPMWTVDQLERYVARKEKQVDSLSA